jgi:hypothetical protein
MARSRRRAWIIFVPLAVAAGLVALPAGIVMWFAYVSYHTNEPPLVPATTQSRDVPTTHSTGWRTGG